MTVEPAIRDALLAAVPSLRAFAISLIGDAHRADDLVQDTIMRAWAKRASTGFVCAAMWLRLPNGGR